MFRDLLVNRDRIKQFGECGVYLYTTSIMISKAGMNVSLFIMTIAFLIILIKNKNIDFQRETKIIIFFLLLVPIFSLFSPGGLNSFFIAFQKNYRYLGIILIPIFTINTKIIKRCCCFIGISFIINFIHAIMIYKNLNWNLFYRYSSFGGNTLNEAHMLSMVLMLFFMLSLYNFKFEKMLIKIVTILVVILMLGSLILSQGRGAWIAIFISILTIIFLLFVTNNKKIVVILTIIFSIVFFSLKEFEIKNNHYISRLNSIRNLNSDSPKIRLLMWKAAVNIYKEHPIFGVGRDNSSKYYVEYFDKTNSYMEISSPKELKNIAIAGNAHNMYFTYLAEGGMLFFLFIGVLIYLLINELLLLRKVSKDGFEYYFLLGLIGMFVSFCIGGLTENSWQDIWKSNVFCWSLGMYLSIKNIENNRGKNENSICY